jgi:hypothetical protein
MTEKLDVHDSDPWSEADVEDLTASLAAGASIEEAAAHISRADTLPDVQRKADELGLKYESRPPRSAVTRKITSAYVLSRPDGYWVGFEFDNGTTHAERAASKEQAEFDTRDRVGDDVPLNGSPLLRPGNKHPARW